MGGQYLLAIFFPLISGNKIKLIELHDCSCCHQHWQYSIGIFLLNKWWVYSSVPNKSKWFPFSHTYFDWKWEIADLQNKLWYWKKNVNMCFYIEGTEELKHAQAGKKRALMLKIQINIWWKKDRNWREMDKLGRRRSKRWIMKCKICLRSLQDAREKLTWRSANSLAKGKKKCLKWERYNTVDVLFYPQKVLRSNINAA